MVRLIYKKNKGKMVKSLRKRAKENNSNHLVFWKCGDCGKYHKTFHSNIPKICECLGKYFKFIKRIKI